VHLESVFARENLKLDYDQYSQYNHVTKSE